MKNSNKSLKKLLFVSFSLFSQFSFKHVDKVSSALHFESPVEEFDYTSYAKTHNFHTLAKMSVEPWLNGNEQESYEQYYLFETGKSYDKVLSTSRAYHEEGKESLTVSIGASILTEEETIRTFGIESSTKIGSLILKNVFGLKWGTAESKSTAFTGSSTINKDKPTGYYMIQAKCKVKTYFLLVRKITRKINRDKKKNVIGHSDYSAKILDGESGLFENFDYDSITII